MDLGLSIRAEPGTVDLAARVEELGYRSLWFADFQLVGGDPYVLAALAAQRTDRLTVGVGVSNPRLRHWSVLANLAATMGTMFPGRFVLGMGTGFSPLKALGLPRATLADLEATLGRIRALSTGGVVADHAAADGGAPPVRFAAGSKVLLPPDRGPRLAVAAGGPQALRLAGRVADEVIVGVADPALLRHQIASVDEGARAAGRPRPLVMVLAGLYLASPDPGDDELVDRMGNYANNMLASNLRSALPHLEELGDLGRAFAAHAAAGEGWRLSERELDSYGKALDPGTADDGAAPMAAAVRAKVLYGDGDALHARLAALAEVGVDRIVFTPDAADPDWFDRCGRVPGLWDQAPTVAA